MEILKFLQRMESSNRGSQRTILNRETEGAGACASTAVGHTYSQLWRLARRTEVRETDLQRAAPPVVQHPVAHTLSAAREAQEQTDSRRDRDQLRESQKDS